MRLLTYNQTIPHMRLIETAPAKLESVCHVFAIGLDLFYTRTQPSQKFDILADDFDYLALLVSAACPRQLCGVFYWDNMPTYISPARARLVLAAAAEVLVFCVQLAMFAMSSATFAGWWFSGNKDLQSAWR
jgi:hypothetical protein